jgi:hypothetical protein
LRPKRQSPNGSDHADGRAQGATGLSYFLRFRFFARFLFSMLRCSGVSESQNARLACDTVANFSAALFRAHRLIRALLRCSARLISTIAAS